MGIIENWENMLDGYIPSQPNPKTRTLYNIYGDIQVDLPSQFMSLEEDSYHIHNQYDKSNCVAHAISELYEIVLKSNDMFEEISYPWIYGNRRMGDSERAGLVPEDALLAVYRDGAVNLETFPWDYEVPRIITKFNANYKELKETALEKVAIEFIRLNTLYDVKRAIYEFGGVLFGTTLFAQFNDISKGETLYMDGPPVKEGTEHTLDTKKYKGKHCMILVGWDDNNEGGHFVCLNSWGSEFGKHGLFYVPYSCIDWNDKFDVNYLGEFWAIQGVGDKHTMKATCYKRKEADLPVEPDEPDTPDTPPVEETGNWEKQDNGSWKYSIDGKYVYGQIKMISGKLYGFDDYGIMYSKKWYNTTDGRWVWFREDGSAVQNNWQKIDGKWYWFDEEYCAVKGFRKIDNVDYYFADTYYGTIKECECLVHCD